MAEPRGDRDGHRDRAARPLPEHVTTPLLTLITARSMDEDYAHVAQQRAAARGDPPAPARRPALDDRRRRRRCSGVMAAVVAVQTDRQAPTCTELSRAALIDQIDPRSAEVAALQREVGDPDRRSNAAADSASTQVQGQLDDIETRVRRAELRTGFSPVRGPGRADHRRQPPGRDDLNDEIRDEDLATLVDGLWQAGAEAIAINDQRLNVLGGIRNTGRAIHVNGRPRQRPPYVVEAIGDNAHPPGPPAPDQPGPGSGSAWSTASTLSTSAENVDDIRLPAAARASPA